MPASHPQALPQPADHMMPLSRYYKPNQRCNAAAEHPQESVVDPQDQAQVDKARSQCVDLSEKEGDKPRAVIKFEEDHYIYRFKSVPRVV